jgi:hypothetical protein
MATCHTFHAATLLRNGKVLVSGGFDCENPTAVTELYDPTSRKWRTTGSLDQARYGMVTTLLPDGEVLLLGGQLFDTTTSDTALLYQPASGAWITANGKLTYSRSSYVTAQLPDGDVSLSGGFSFNDGVYLEPTAAEGYHFRRQSGD